MTHTKFQLDGPTFLAENATRGKENIMQISISPEFPIPNPD